jgi:Raf kinase inhibitor-like YbhB/YbcL family protein
VRRALIACALVPALAGCGSSGGGGGEGKPLPARGDVAVASSAFSFGGTIPKRFTCDGEGVSPPLEWSGVPRKTQSLILVVSDPDAPDQTYFHWVVYDFAPDRHEIAAGARPAGGADGKNSNGKTGWTPPCPPKGDSAHRYLFRLFAESAATGLAPGAEPAAVLDAAARHKLADGVLAGRYGR